MQNNTILCKKNSPEFFRKPNNARIMYVLSAACILAGAAIITSPIYKNLELIKEQFYVVGALALYELILLLTGYLVCRWKSGNDDAKTLTLLIIIFLASTPIALDTISLDFPEVALGLGICGMVLALVKLYVVQKYITHSFGIGLNSTFIVLLLASFIAPFALGLGIKNGVEKQIWLIGWWITFVGGIMISVIAARLSPRVEIHNNNGRPFIHTSKMYWILTMVILFASFVRQYALNYAYNLHQELAISDFLPTLALMIILGSELFRTYIEDHKIIVVFLSVPLFFTICTIAYSSHYTSYSLYLTSYPPVFLLVMGSALLLLARHRSKRSLYFLATAYFLVAIPFSNALFSLDVSKALSPNWFLFGIALTFVFFAIAVIFSRVGFAIIGVVVVSLDIAYGLYLAYSSHSLLWQWFISHHLRPSTLPLLIFGGLILSLSWIFSKKISQLLVFIGAFALAGWSIDLYYYFLEHSLTIHYPVVACFLVSIGVVLVAKRNDYWFLFAPGVLPFLVVAHKPMIHNIGWILIFLSFLLLIIGGHLSFRAVNTRNEN